MNQVCSIILRPFYNCYFTVQQKAEIYKDRYLHRKLYFCCQKKRYKDVLKFMLKNVFYSTLLKINPKTKLCISKKHSCRSQISTKTQMKVPNQQVLWLGSIPILPWRSQVQSLPGVSSNATRSRGMLTKDGRPLGLLYYRR